MYSKKSWTVYYRWWNLPWAHFRYLHFCWMLIQLQPPFWVKKIWRITHRFRHSKDLVPWLAMNKGRYVATNYSYPKVCLEKMRSSSFCTSNILTSCRLLWRHGQWIISLARKIIVQDLLNYVWWSNVHLQNSSLNPH